MANDVRILMVPISKFGPPALLYLVAWETDDLESFAQAVLIPPTPAKGARRAYSELAHSERIGKATMLENVVEMAIRDDIRTLILEIPVEERVERIEMREPIEDELHVAATLGRYQSRTEATELAQGTAIQSALLAPLGLRNVIITPKSA